MNSTLTSGRIIHCANSTRAGVEKNEEDAHRRERHRGARPQQPQSAPRIRPLLAQGLEPERGEERAIATKCSVPATGSNGVITRASPIAAAMSSMTIRTNTTVRAMRDEERPDDEPLRPWVPAIEWQPFGEVDAEEHHARRPEDREQRLVDGADRVETSRPVPRPFATNRWQTPPGSAAPAAGATPCCRARAPRRPSNQARGRDTGSARPTTANDATSYADGAADSRIGSRVTAAVRAWPGRRCGLDLDLQDPACGRHAQRTEDIDCAPRSRAADTEQAVSFTDSCRCRLGLHLAERFRPEVGIERDFRDLVPAHAARRAGRRYPGADTSSTPRTGAPAGRRERRTCAARFAGGIRAFYSGRR